MISAGVKVNVQQEEIKELVERQCRKGMNFSLNFRWYSIQLAIVH